MLRSANTGMFATHVMTHVSVATQKRTDLKGAPSLASSIGSNGEAGAACFDA